MPYSKEVYQSIGDNIATSWEIVEAITSLSRDVIQTWESPTDTELLAIWERVTKNGLISASQFVWGASGNHWADGLTIGKDCV